jgi:hypothetical protein
MKSLKYENVLKAYEYVTESREGPKAYFKFFYYERRHQGLMAGSEMRFTQVAHPNSGHQHEQVAST